MPYYATHSDGCEYRVAVIKDPSVTGCALIEWLEGPRHEVREHLCTILIRPTNKASS